MQKVRFLVKLEAFIEQRKNERERERDSRQRFLERSSRVIFFLKSNYNKTITKRYERDEGREKERDERETEEEG